MRVLVDGRSIGAHMTGMDRCIIEMTRSLVELHGPNSVRLAIRAEGKDLVLASLLPSEILQSVNYRFLSLDGALGMARVAKDVGATVYQHFFIFAPRVDVPLVSMVFDTNHAYLPGYYRRLDTAKRLIASSMLSWTVHAAQHVVVNSEFVREQLQLHFPSAAERVRVVALGADHIPVSNPQSTGDYFLYVGQDRPHKNLGRLYEAYLLYRAAGGRRGLWLVGNFDPKHSTLLRGLRGKLDSHVRILGYLSDEELARVHSHAHALVMPSISEGFGLPVLEAMARGVPVICSATSSLGEVAGTAALLVDPLDVYGIASALLRLDEDVALREQLRARGYKQAARFTWRRTAEHISRVYREISTCAA